MVRLHHICLHHTPLHHLPAPHPTPTLHHTRPAPPGPRSASCPAPLSPCTTLHHTRLHHIRPASHPGPRSAPCPAPLSSCTTLHHPAPPSPTPHPPAPHWTTRMHHICPVPHLPCTTLACTIFALLSQDSQLKGTTRNNNENRHF